MWHRRLAPLALVLAALLAWSNSFSGPFVFDDLSAILANPTLENFRTALSPPRDGGTVSGRPIVNLSFALNRAIGGTEVWSYHAFNLAIHILAGLTLFGLVRRTLARTRFAPHALSLAFSATLLWLLHPLTTSAVTYVVQRAESLMALSFLLTLYAFARSTETKCHLLNDTSLGGPPQKCHLIDDTFPRRFSAPWLIVSLLACLAGMACKEVMAVAPLVVLLYDRTFVAGTFRAALRLRWPYYSALAATWLLLAALVLANSGRAGTASLGKISFDYALTQSAAIVRYLGLAFWPQPLVFDYGTPLAASVLAVWPQFALLLALLGLAVATLRRAPAAGFLFAAFSLILAPSSSFVAITTQTIAEHRMYLPLTAVAVAATFVLHAVFKTRALGVALLLALALGVATAHRNGTYRTALALWSDTAVKRPDNARAHNELA
ncbi:MAG: hypothetical protein ABIR80_16775, partial [Opitutaceae bacterium]